MANTELKVRIVICTKTASDWATDTTVLLNGEFALESDTHKIKAGNGIDIFKDLPYINLTQEEVQSLITAASHSHSNLDILSQITSPFTTELKSKLDGIAAGANKTTVDSALNANSTNPVQNKIIKSALDGKVPTGRKVNNKPLSADITLGAADVGADPAGSSATALSDAKSYTDTKTSEAKSYADQKVADLVDSAPDTMNTLNELADAIASHQDVTDALNAAIGNKVDKVSGKGLSTNDYTTAEKNKLAGIASGAEVNQNAFSNVKVGETTIAADAKTDTLELVPGANITITPDASTDKLTIAAKDTTYSDMVGATASEAGTHGLVPAPTAGAATRYLRNDGKWVTPPDTKYSDMKGATASTAGTHGLVPAPAAGKQGEFLRADGVWATPTNTTYGAAGSNLGLVKSGGDVTIESGVITVNDDSHNHTIANVDGLQSALDGKAAKSHGTHVTYGSSAPSAPGTANAGSAASVSRSDHVHPLQTSVSGSSGSCTGNSATATKLKASTNFSITGAATASNAEYDGSQNVALNVTRLHATALYVDSNETLVLNGNFS